VAGGAAASPAWQKECEAGDWQLRKLSEEEIVSHRCGTSFCHAGIERSTRPATQKINCLQTLGIVTKQPVCFAINP